MKRSIKLIIVDLYGVISMGSFWDITRWLARRYKLDPQRVYDVLYHKYFNAAAMGKLTERQFFMYALRELGIDMDWREVRNRHLGYQKPNVPAIELCRRLRAEGYTVLLLSKNIPAHLRHTIAAFGLKRYFPHIINTYDLQMPKASKRTMRLVLKKFGVRPGEALLCDDQDFNLVEAKKLGMHTILYKDFRQFKKDLRDVLEN